MSASEVPWPVMRAKTLFTSCMDVHAMDELGLFPLFNLLESLNLPMIPAALTNETTNFIQQIASVKRNIGRDIFFGMDIMQDPRNNSRYVIIFDTPNHSSPFISNKDLEKRMQTIRSRLRKLEDLDEEDTDGYTLDEDEEMELIYMTNVIKHVISNGTIDVCTSEDESNISEKQLTNCIYTIYEISNTFYHIARTNKNQSVMEEDLSDDNYMYVDELQKLTDEYVIDVNSSLMPKPIWRPFVESIFENFVSLDLDNKDKILVGNLNYLKNAALILASYEEEDLESYIWWVVVDMVVPLSSKRLRDIWDTYVNKLMQVEVREPRSLECASDVNEMMGMAVSWLFVDQKFHNNEISKVMEMLEDIKEAFASLVLKTDWMDQSTKMATLYKSQKMNSEIGFPKWLFNEEKLDEYYKNIKVIDLSETNHLDNMMQILRVVLNTTWSSLHDEDMTNKSHWVSQPIDVNAFHSFHTNHITIPVGILKFPFYELGLEALNYGAIGSVIGHELTHGFDNSGRHYDSDGNLRQWWTNETLSEYSDKTQCFINHYNTYYESEIDGYIDGELTLDENIADNGGLNEAFIAYERWKTRHGQEPLLSGFTDFTHEQLLFLSFAHLWCESYISSALTWMLEDSHSPNHVRVQGVLKNSKEFSTTWNCPVGSNMNPEKKCRLW